MKRIIVDVLLLIFMLAEYSRVHLPPEMHEIIGIGLILLVTVHMILNRNYFKAIPRGKYSAKRMVELLSTIGFFAVFILTCIFGILSSQEILPFINIKSLTAIYLHKILAYACIILLGIHLGIKLKRMFKKLEKRIGKTIYPVYLLIMVLGIYSAMQVDFLNHITGSYWFSTVTGNILINSLEYLSIILMTTVIVHLIEKYS